MEPLENERFEDAWRRAFEGAEEAPSEGLWGRIERRLPAERGKRRPVVWWWAAAASLLLTLLAGDLGWWAGRQRAETENRVATTAPADRRSSAGTAPEPHPETPDAELSKPNEALARRAAQPTAPPASSPAVSEAASADGRTAQRIPRPNPLGNEAVRPGVSSGENPVGTAPAAELPRLATRPSGRAARREDPAQPEVSPAVSNASSDKTGVEVAAASPAETSDPAVSSLTAAQPGIALDFLSGKAAQPLNVALRVRPPAVPAAPKPLFMPPPEGETERKAAKGSKFWASLGAAPVGFDPRVRLGGSVAALARAATNSAYYQNASIGRGSLAAPVAESQPALSYRVGGRVGWQMSEHWSLESGVEYLNGQSTLQSGLVLVNRATNEATSLFAEALSNKSTGASLDAFDVGNLAAQNSFVPADNQLRSTYQYVSVPLQVGYRLWPESRMEALLSAGFSSDLFLSNTLQPTGTSNLNTVRYSPADGVYRQLLWSGLGGLGLRYRLDTHWGLGLNGTLRRALTSGVQSSSGVQTFPREVGVGLRVDYRF